MTNPNAQFLISFVVGGLLMLVALVVNEWLQERKFRRELQRMKFKEQSK